jgi:osmotically-inducible protein OsmY
MDIMSQIKLIISAIISAFLLSSCAAFAGATAAVADDPRSSGVVIDDNTITSRLQSKFNNKKHYPDSNIYANSYNKTILITGQVPDRKIKEKAEFDAKAMPGVQQVYNYSIIRLPQSIASRSTDSFTTTQVRTKILGLKGVRGVNVTVVTTNSVVYLLGIVNKAEATKVAEAAASVAGVKEVITLFEYING